MKFVLLVSVTFVLTAADDSVRYDYTDGPFGVENWKKHFPECGGQAQSPIDLDIPNSEKKKFPNPLRSTNINVQPIEIEIVRSRLSATFNFYWACCAPNIYGGPLKGIYRFHSLHCHWGEGNNGSEHTISGMRYPLECHLVFYNVRYTSLDIALGHSNGLAVFGIMYTVVEGAKSSPLFAGIGHVKNVEDISRCFYPHTSALSDIIQLAKFPYASYTGSLTSPPCSEAATFIIMTKPLAISQEQMNSFHELKDDEGNPIKTNARGLQPLNSRIVYTSG